MSFFHVKGFLILRNPLFWYNKLDNLDNTNYDLILIMGNMNDYSNNIFNNENLGHLLDDTLNTASRQTQKNVFFPNALFPMRVGS